MAGEQGKDGGRSFLPSDYVEQKTEAKFFVVVFFLFVVVMVGVLGAFMVTSRAWKDVKAEQVAINQVFETESAKLEQLKQLQNQRGEMIETARITAALLEPVPRSLLVAELVRRLPEGAMLAEVQLDSERLRPSPPPAEADKKKKTGSLTDKQGEPEKPKVEPPRFTHSLQIDGLAVDNTLVADYLLALQGSSLLSNVELVFIKQERAQGEELRKFQIDAMLNTAVDPETVEGVQPFEIASAVEEG
ncbi:MAG: PilN domain-containing protein [Planctomycetota bacterium]